MPSSAKRRDSMPVRSRIHSSCVSIWVSNQVFGTARGGSAEPDPRDGRVPCHEARISDPQAVARELGSSQAR